VLQEASHKLLYRYASTALPQLYAAMFFHDWLSMSINIQLMVLPDPSGKRKEPRKCHSQTLACLSLSTAAQRSGGLGAEDLCSQHAQALGSWHAVCTARTPRTTLAACCACEAAKGPALPPYRSRSELGASCRTPPQEGCTSHAGYDGPPDEEPSYLKQENNVLVHMLKRINN
jgi:hypothetical protein